MYTQHFNFFLHLFNFNRNRQQTIYITKKVLYLRDSSIYNNIQMKRVSWWFGNLASATTTLIKYNYSG